MNEANETTLEACGKHRAGPRRTRIALLVGSAELAGWQTFVVQKVLADPAVELAFVIEGRPQEADAGSRLQRCARTVWHCIDRIEAALSRRLFERALTRKGMLPEKLDHRLVSLRGLLDAAKVPTVRLDASAEGTSRPAADPGFEALKSADLDVVLALEPSLCQSGLPAIAKHGVWTLSSCGARADGTTPLGFWNVYRNDAFADVHVMATRQGAPSDRVVLSGSYGTFRWSWNLNAVLLGHKASSLVVDALRRVQGFEPGDEPRAAPARYADKRAARASPSLGQALTALVKCAGRVLWEAVRRSFVEERWRLLLVVGARGGPGSRTPIVIAPPAESYWADPFVIRWNGACYIFCEEYIYAERRGVISCIELGDVEQLSGPARLSSRRVLDAPHHLSYPFLFRHKGGLYMIPESSGNGTIDLWRCIDFPGVWHKHKTMMDGVSAADTTLLQWNGKWWLFTNIDRNGVADHRSELHVFHSDDPIEGPWRSHALNPVVVDARRARMAGGFLTARDGRPVRCCQVQGRRYGESVAYNLIEELTETRYTERKLGDPVQIAGTPSARRHHIAQNDGLIVADECLDSFKLGRIFHLSWRSSAVPGTKMGRFRFR